MGLIEDMEAAWKAECERPAQLRMVYFSCRHCRCYGTCPDPGILKCPKCGERTTLGEALNATEWDEVKI